MNLDMNLNVYSKETLILMVQELSCALAYEEESSVYLSEEIDDLRAEKRQLAERLKRQEESVSLRQRTIDNLTAEKRQLAERLKQQEEAPLKKYDHRVRARLGVGCEKISAIKAVRELLQKDLKHSKEIVEGCTIYLTDEESGDLNEVLWPLGYYVSTL